MTHMLISHPGGLRDLGVVDTVTLLACYIAAISHDFGHPGEAAYIAASSTCIQPAVPGTQTRDPLKRSLPSLCT